MDADLREQSQRALAAEQRQHESGATGRVEQEQDTDGRHLTDEVGVLLEVDARDHGDKRRAHQWIGRTVPGAMPLPHDLDRAGHERVELADVGVGADLAEREVSRLAGLERSGVERA